MMMPTPIQNLFGDLFKKLSKAAAFYHLSRLEYKGDARTRRAEFVEWINALQNVTYVSPDTLPFIQDYPTVTAIAHEPNMILAQIIKGYLKSSVTSYLTKNDQLSAYAIMAILQRLFAH